ncbi:protein RIC-3 isoform X2 [Betta splendens]|uniref:Protein RIC-3 isoform X2 n=1 Tax=Betta splendens TaxID=158456 RepID=A0A8M1HC76_BETSP|nr:protein RIC-3 isoform X2 [Betta splendens]
MSITTCQKVTLISCSVLCVSLFLPRMLLPREKKDMGQPEVGPGFYPPVTRQLSSPEDAEQWGVDPSNSLIRSAEAMAKVKGIGRGKKYNLMAQVIPIYGFGILLYILYIIYKLTCKEKTKLGNHSTGEKANMEKRTDYELVRLQQRLLHTEQMMESIFSENGHSSRSGRRRRSKTAPMKKEKLRWHFRQITQLMQEGRLEEATPEMEAEELAYGAEWEVEVYPECEPSDSQGSDPSTMKDSLDQPTAEALAEEMEQEEEDVTARKLSVVQEEDEEEEHGEEDDEDEEDVEAEELEDDSEEDDEEEAEKRQLLSPRPSQSAVERKQERLHLEKDERGRKKISFNNQRDVYHYPKEDSYEEEEDEDEGEGMEVEEEGDADEDDPVMQAESVQFSGECCSNPEEEAQDDEEECLLVSASVEGDSQFHADAPKEDRMIVLRMRNRRET